jgi:hypothetical protein
MRKQKISCLTPLNFHPFDFLFQDLVHPAQKLSNPNVFVGKLPLQPKDVLTKIGLVANLVRKNYHVDSISAQFHVMKEIFVHPVTRKVFNCVHVKNNKKNVIALNLNGNVRINVAKN